MPEVNFVFDCAAIVSDFFYGPDPMECPEMVEEVVAMEAESSEDPVLAGDALGKALHQFSAKLTSSDTESVCETMCAEYDELFGPAVLDPTVTEGPFLVQSGYDEHMGLQRGASAQAMLDLLGSVGMEMEEEGGTPADHLCVEIEYVQVMLEAGLESNPALGKQGAVFCRELLVPWVKLMIKDVTAKKPDGFYASAGILLLELVQCMAKMGTNTAPIGDLRPENEDAIDE